MILNAALAWLVTTVDILEAARWPVLAVMPFTLVFGVLVGAITRGIASGPISGVRGIVGRGLVAVAVGVVVGESAALAVFSGSIDRQLELQAGRNADRRRRSCRHRQPGATARYPGRARQGGRHRTHPPGRSTRDRALRIPSHAGLSPDRITGCPVPGPKPERQ